MIITVLLGVETKNLLYIHEAEKLPFILLLQNSGICSAIVVVVVVKTVALAVLVVFTHVIVVVFVAAVVVVAVVCDGAGVQT